VHSEAVQETTEKKRQRRKEKMKRKRLNLNSEGQRSHIISIRGHLTCPRRLSPRPRRGDTTMARFFQGNTIREKAKKHKKRKSNSGFGCARAPQGMREEGPQGM